VRVLVIPDKFWPVVVSWDVGVSEHTENAFVPWRGVFVQPLLDRIACLGKVFLFRKYKVRLWRENSPSFRDTGLPLKVTYEY
jgi:hypothetical protein